ncbi:MAG: 5-(carboxyamino)imidazole ribonucleotide mutase [Armatimonadetes bacterium]|nr:5-(carboxyamino)imidazole ribonucleotide mutase [Armatimonadota bacterium]MDW8123014.1 5-(carboxyamino)imidazole ribonucleotide mutase [Armatimonadota bacterium]
MTNGEPFVAILMGSKSDWPTMKSTAETLKNLGIPFEARVLSAHRTPEALVQYIKEAEARGAKVFIAAAGGAAHLAGVVAAHTLLPVIGVPMETNLSGGLDSLLSMVSMPGGIPVGVVAVGKAGATNAALLAAAILAVTNPQITDRLKAYREQRAKAVLDESVLNLD